jgi:hypothetical protein
VVAIDFEIGQIDVPSTRENVKYTRRTLDNIRKVIGDAVRQIRNDVSKNIISGTAKDIPQAIEKAKEIVASGNINSATTGLERSLIQSQIARKLKEFGDIIVDELGVNFTGNVFDPDGDINRHYVQTVMHQYDIPVDFFLYKYNQTTERLKKECSTGLGCISTRNVMDAVYLHDSKKSPIMRVQLDVNETYPSAIIGTPKAGFVIDDTIKDNLEKYLSPFFNFKCISDLPMPTRSATPRTKTARPRFFIRNLIGNNVTPFETNTIKDLIDDYGDDYTMVLIPYERGGSAGGNVFGEIIANALRSDVNGLHGALGNGISLDVNSKRIVEKHLEEVSSEIEDKYVFIATTEGNFNKIMEGRYGDKFLTLNNNSVLTELTKGILPALETAAQEIIDSYSDSSVFLHDLNRADSYELREIYNNMKQNGHTAVSQDDSVIINRLFNMCDNLPELATLNNVVSGSHFEGSQFIWILDFILCRNLDGRDITHHVNMNNPFNKVFCDGLAAMFGGEVTYENFVSYVQQCITEYDKDVNETMTKCVAALEKEMPIEFKMLRLVHPHVIALMLSDKEVRDAFESVLKDCV